MSWLLIFSLFIRFLFPVQTDQAGIFKTTKGSIKFISEAPLETISAVSENLKGVIDTSTKSFAFTVTVKSFNGFNSKLQQEHFNENYLESVKYPSATFTGKIIEEVDFSQPGVYPVRAKGALTIHGVKQERLIKAQIEISKKSLLITSKFIVALADHDITIPRVVYQKIAPEIEVVVKADLIPVHAK